MFANDAVTVDSFSFSLQEEMESAARVYEGKVFSSIYKAILTTSLSHSLFLLRLRSFSRARDVVVALRGFLRNNSGAEAAK